MCGQKGWGSLMDDGTSLYSFEGQDIFFIILGVFTHAYNIINKLIYMYIWSMRMPERLILVHRNMCYAVLSTTHQTQHCWCVWILTSLCYKTFYLQNMITALF